MLDYLECHRRLVLGDDVTRARYKEAQASAPENLLLLGDLEISE